MTVDRRHDLDDGEAEDDAEGEVTDSGERAQDPDSVDGACQAGEDVADVSSAATDAAAHDAAGEAAGSEEDAPDPTPGPPGTRLRMAREARELSIDDLARTLNLSRRVLSALEADDYEALPSPTFVRGYIKSLARLLGEAPQPLLDAYEARGGALRLQVRPTPMIESAQRLSLAQRRPGVVMVAVIVLILLALAGLALVLWPTDVPVAGSGVSTAPAVAAGAAVRSAAAPAPVTPSSVTEDEPTEAATDTTPARERDAVEGLAASSEPAAAQGAGVATGAAPDAAATLASPASGLEAVAVEAAVDGRITVQAGGEDHLHFEFSGDCWVEVRDGDDRAVYQDLNRAGQTLDLWGRAPFRIRLGYAPAVELAYNDSRVPLVPHTRNDVAALVIGR